MRKVYHLFFLLNVLFGISIFTNILLLSQPSSYSIPLMIGVVVFYIAMIILYFKKRGKITTDDIIMLSIYAIFLIGYIIFIILYQSHNIRTYNMLYLSKLIILPSIIFCLYNVISRD